jgi:peptide/nickel transport system substrate-binding protein
MMHGRSRLVSVATVVALTMIGAACTGDSQPTPSPSPTPEDLSGGTLRVGLSNFGLSNNLDPTGEYTGGGWGALWPQLRTLVAFKVAAGAAGTEIVPDLSTEVPQPTEDGLTYTFDLKPGIRFGPPADREITSSDVAYAFQRINTKSLAAQYGFYYCGTIVGMTCDARSPDQPIDGIETPDADTIVFHLTQPTGDFLARLTMPATAPVPAEVGACFLKAGEYGRSIVASGPYMIEGSDAVDASSCETIEPTSGFDPERELTLVRNPSHDPATDQETGRLAYPDEIRFTIDVNVEDIFNKIQAGELDLSWYDQPPKATLNAYLTDPTLTDHLHSIAAGATEYFQMNLTAPPFDDPHVRRAVNYVIDRAAVLQAWGGETAGTIATHLIPSYVLGDVPASDFDLYPSEGSQGDVEAAKSEMALSGYDADGDGVCDADACSEVLMINQNVEPWTLIEPILVDDLAQIGIELVPRQLDFGAAFSAIQDPTAGIPSQIAVAWGYDFPDAFPYYTSLMDGRSINATANLNFSMVGLTPEMAKEIGVTYPDQPIPSVDAEIDACEAITVGTERNTCWADLERTVMADVVPIAPLVWWNLLVISGESVVHWESSPQQGQVLMNISVAQGATP